MKLTYAILFLGVALVFVGAVSAEGTMDSRWLEDGSSDPIFNGVPMAYYTHAIELREPVVIFKVAEPIITNLGPEPLAYGLEWELRLQLFDPVYDPAFSGSLVG